jgi:hypothetical protein
LHRQSLAPEKRPIPTYLGSQTQEESLYPASQTKEADQAIKQKKVVSCEPGQTIYRQPNAPYTLSWSGPCRPIQIVCMGGNMSTLNSRVVDHRSCGHKWVQVHMMADLILAVQCRSSGSQQKIPLRPNHFTKETLDLFAFNPQSTSG